MVPSDMFLLLSFFWQGGFILSSKGQQKEKGKKPERQRERERAHFPFGLETTICKILPRGSM